MSIGVFGGTPVFPLACRHVLYLFRNRVLFKLQVRTPIEKEFFLKHDQELALYRKSTP